MRSLTRHDILRALDIDPAYPLAGSDGSIFEVPQFSPTHIILKLGEPDDIDSDYKGRVTVVYAAEDGKVLITGQKGAWSITSALIFFL